ncbi:hypothetical protein [Sinisalibacter aestuarii]|uniref:V-type ATP synthase subunit E n=1 Tax=Sinisalibacter aestuarii TaxID=2949426 RepID=A0ABQ5LVE5_9RHOB|nr:hypothetical protein [Sinisalibacter aestuarii]GKY88753.1 hypothetical protein STA1M1_26220 [Sinisalibacter aestuarii]
MADERHTDRAEALIARIEAATAQEVQRIHREAEAAGAVLVARAHARARKRMHDEIGALRRARDEARRHEKARLDTARRQVRQREASRLIETGLPALEAAFATLWADPETREGWAQAAVAMAARRLIPGAWVIEHPAGWDKAELQSIAKAAKAACGTAPELRADADLAAGLRIRDGAVCLDATTAALMDNPQELGARLLAEIERDGEDAT